MLRKNVASQVTNFVLVNATTGAALTGATVTVKVSLDGTQSAGAGTVTELGTGQYKYVPTQGETNGASLGLCFTATNAVPVGQQFFMMGFDPTLANWPVNLVQILATTLTETVGGYLAAAFKKLFDVVTPVLTAASVNQTGDAYGKLAGADAEPAGVPAANASPIAKIGWLFTLSRNKLKQTSTTQTVRNDGDSGNIATATVGDTGSEFTRAKYT